MKLSDARIGYAGYSPGLSGPGDRRRFCAYASQKGLAFERAELDRGYDLALVTHNGDISGWTDRKQREGSHFKFVFELVDAYFNQTGRARRWLKGSARYLLGMDSKLSPDFLRTLIRACEEADAVICSTEEQRRSILPYNPNTHVSFDWVDADLGQPKRDWTRGEKLKIAWEGQSTTVPNLQLIRDTLNRFPDQVELHVVTDPLVYRHFGRFRPYPVEQALEGITCEIFIHDWEAASFSQHITNCDLAVIPIDAGNRLAWGKPENKLILLWKLGLPVLTTDTPAYHRAMAGAGVDMTCATAADWASALQRTIETPPDDLEAVAAKCRAYAGQAYSMAAFQRSFDETFRSVGFDIS